MPLDDHTLILQLEREVERIQDASLEAIENLNENIDSSPMWDAIGDRLDKIEKTQAELAKIVNKLTLLVNEILEVVSDA